MVLKGVMVKKNKKNRQWKICHFEPTLKFNLFWDWDFSTFFLIIWFKSTKMKLRPYFAMELVEKLMKKTWKYIIYSFLTEKVLTEWPCTIYLLCCVMCVLFYFSYYSNVTCCVLCRFCCCCVICNIMCYVWCYVLSYVLRGGSHLSPVVICHLRSRQLSGSTAFIPRCSWRVSTVIRW